MELIGDHERLLSSKEIIQMLYNHTMSFPYNSKINRSLVPFTFKVSKFLESSHAETFLYRNDPMIELKKKNVISRFKVVLQRSM